VQFLLLRPLSAALVAPEVIWLSLLNATLCTFAPVLMVMMAIERIGATLTAQAGMVGPISTVLLGVLAAGRALQRVDRGRHGAGVGGRVAAESGTHDQLIATAAARHRDPSAQCRCYRQRLGVVRQEASMDLGIAGKWALVCASSKGLGKGCAQALVAEGVNVVITARGEKPSCRLPQRRAARLNPAVQVRRGGRHHHRRRPRGGAGGLPAGGHPGQQRRWPARR
jgi:hypothetical protein